MKLHIYMCSVFLFLLCCTSKAQFVSYTTPTYPRLTKINPDVQLLVSQVSVEKLEDNIRYLQNLGIRAADTKIALQAQNWLVEQLESYGLQVYVQHFLYGKDTLEAGNVIAIQKGTEYPDEYIIVSSHYDHAAGPGADDNASGTSGVLEIARILSKQSFRRSIIYMSFNAEEYGVTGSHAFAKKCFDEKINILGCFNLDMIGYIPEGKPLQIFYNTGPFITSHLTDFFQNTATLYLPNVICTPFSIENMQGRGDDMRFIAHDYAATYIGDIEYDGFMNPCYHKPCDTLGEGVNNMELVKSYTQATLAALAEISNYWGAMRLRAIQSSAGVKIDWQPSVESEKYKLFRNDEFIAEIKDTFYIDNNVKKNEEYVYYVKSLKKGTTEYDYESNRDTVMIVNPITLPYYNNFESGMSDFIKDKNNAWQLSNTKSHSGNFSLSNCADTYPISIMTLNWFSIPDTVKNVTMSLFLNTKRVEFDKNIYAYVEITKDKRNWYKLLQIKLDDAKWDHYKFSLNEFIGEPYIEIRFRLNACSSATMRKLYIDDLNINFDAKEIPTPKIVDISREHDSLLTIKWEGINYEDDNTFFYDGKYYFHVGYNIYRNGVKLNSNSINAKQYIDSYDSTKPSSYYCYQVSAIYNVENKDKEGEYSVSRCYDPNSIEEDIHLWELNIAPNPSNHSISIYTGLRNPYTITIFGLDGIKVLQEQYFFDGDIDLSYLPKGTYFLNIVTNNSSVSKRIVIE